MSYDCEDCPCPFHQSDLDNARADVERIRAEAKAEGAAEEREACARIAFNARDKDGLDSMTADVIRSAISARGTTTPECPTCGGDGFVETKTSYAHDAWKPCPSCSAPTGGTP